MVFAELGILSENGSDDLLEMVLMILDDNRDSLVRPSLHISNLYKRVSISYKEKGVNRASSDKAIEQRIRRTIHTALVNIANLGVEDFGNYKFDKYASALFGFQEVKKIMDSIRKGETLKGTINIKTFLNGILAVIEGY